jgi:hypothetical protein
MNPTAITASRVVPAPPAVVFAFLDDLRNHWCLAPDRYLQLLEIVEGPERASGGHVVIRGPVGIRRHASTRVVTSHWPSTLSGTAHLGRRTIVEVRWALRGCGGDAAETRVDLSANVVTAGPLDRLLLRIGGRYWIRRLFDTTLERLAAQAPAATIAAPGDGWVAVPVTG